MERENHEKRTDLYSSAMSQLMGIMSQHGVPMAEDPETGVMHAFVEDKHLNPPKEGKG